MDFLLSMAQNTLAFVVVISCIVFIHEFGHYYVARILGVHAKVFSIGMGPEMVGWYDARRTWWRIAWFPIGGYIRFAEAEDGTSDVPLETAPLWARCCIVVAGPVANLLFAWVVLCGLLYGLGRPEIPARVAMVVPESAAAEAGIVAGDRIRTINGRDVERFQDVQQEVLLQGDKPSWLDIEREGVLLHVMLHPRMVEEQDALGNRVTVPRLGMSAVLLYLHRYELGFALREATKELGSLIRGIYVVMGQMMVGARDTRELSGVLRIAQVSGQSMQHGAVVLIWFMAMLSINLGVLNLLPIPILDGGHLMFYGYEALRGKPLSRTVQHAAQRVGVLLVIGLGLYALYNDVWVWMYPH